MKLTEEEAQAELARLKKLMDNYRPCEYTTAEEYNAYLDVCDEWRKLMHRNCPPTPTKEEWRNWQKKYSKFLPGK